MTENQRVAIVTGAAGGIGRAMVRGLLAAGIRVAGVDACKRSIEMTPLCKVEVTLLRVLGSREVRRGGGVDE